MKEKLTIFQLVSLILIFSIESSCSYQPYNDTDPDYGASVHHLKLLVQAELTLLPTIFSAYENELQTGTHADMGSYIHDFISSNLIPQNGSKVSLKEFVKLLSDGKVEVQTLTDETVKHPLKSFRVIRRFFRFISNFAHGNVTSSQGLIKATTEMQQRMKFPKESDVEIAMQNILRLRQIFRISVMNLLEGQLEDLKTDSGLTVTQLVEIADHALSLKMYTHAVDLYDGAVQRCDEKLAQDFMDCSALNVNAINMKLEKIILEHDQLLVGSGYDPNDLNVVPPDSSPFVFDLPLKNLTSANFLNRRFLQIDKELDAFMNQKKMSKLEMDVAVSPFMFEKICRGEALLVETNPTSQKCFYMHSTHPTYLVGPLKVEMHSEDPHLVQIHEVISNKEIIDLQQEVQLEMRQSRTTSTDGDDAGRTSRFRTSANAWIEDNTDEKFQYLNERISRITGLNSTGFFSSEIVQIAAYNPGGHYTPHSDAMFEDVIVKRLPESEFERGDRIMTFMIYLSDVEKGGGTGFPTLRTLIRPVKGSAVLWYNLNSDGTINYNVIHGGCPVLYGTKWIANKWIRSNDQMFIKKCPRSKEGWKMNQNLIITS